MIVAESLSKYYGAHAAVSDLSFSINKGEVVGLLGLNGAGKTTTLKMLSGGLLPTSGAVKIDGLDMADEPETLRARIGFLPETPPLYPEMTVEDFLTFVARIKGMRGDVSKAVNSAMEATDLQERRHARIGTLSHGFQRRVGIAHAIVHGPALMLLDEPTSGLDPVQVVQMRKVILNLAEQNTIIVSSHILSEITQVCDRLLVLQNGRLVAEGTQEELAKRVVGTTRVSVDIRGERVALDGALQGASWYEAHQIESESDGVLSASIEMKEDAREDLAQRLVGADLGLRRMERVQLQLENIFLQLTQNGEAPAGIHEEAAS